MAVVAGVPDARLDAVIAQLVPTTVDAYQLWDAVEAEIRSELTPARPLTDAEHYAIGRRCRAALPKDSIMPVLTIGQSITLRATAAPDS